MKITGLRNVKFGVNAVRRLCKEIRRKGPDEYGAMSVHGIGVEWIEEVVLLADAQLKALELLKEAE